MSRVFVFGNAMVDLSMTVPHLPLPGETLVASGAVRLPGGKGLNQAIAASRMGAQTSFCAAIGNDADGLYLAGVLAAEKLAPLRLLHRREATDLSVLLVGADSENCIVSLCGCADSLGLGDVDTALEGIAAGDWLMLQGNLPGDVTLAAARRARGGGASVLFNPAPLRWPAGPVLAEATVVVANRSESMSLTGISDPVAAAEALRAAGPAVAMVTLGEVGCVWADEAGMHGQAAPSVQAVDTTGAGDVFCGTLVAGLAAGTPLAEAIATAQRAAAVATTWRGAWPGPLTPEKVAALPG